MVRQLLPWYANLKKRQVKAPKIYFHDTGLLHHLLGIRKEKELLSHPKCGTSWEGYVIEETIKATEPDEVYFWGTHSGAEIDLVLVKKGRMLGVECKRVDAPRITPSMQTAREDLHLEQIAVVYPGTKRYSLGDGVTAVPLDAVADGMKGLFAKK
jgi:predicted AAA+ superfamily ATPase